MRRRQEPVRPNDYRVLRVSENSSPQEVRRAWKRLARRIHPDIDPRPNAVRRFQRAHAAFRRVLRAAATHVPDVKPVAQAVAPARYACRGCCDTYTHGVECPRCELPLHDRAKGEVEPLVESAAVAAMITQLETPRGPSVFELDPALRIPLMAAVLALFALGQAKIGLWPIATMSVCFALFAIAADAHEKWRASRLFG